MRVGVGNEVLIGGLIVGGHTMKRIIVRAIGPSLGGNRFSVLADPVVELHGSDGQLIALNDDWATGSQEGEITATGLQPGNSLESALIATIPSGNYTAIVQGRMGARVSGWWRFTIWTSDRKPKLKMNIPALDSSDVSRF